MRSPQGHHWPSFFPAHRESLTTELIAEPYPVILPPSLQPLELSTQQICQQGTGRQPAPSLFLCSARTPRHTAELEQWKLSWSSDVVISYPTCVKFYSNASQYIPWVINSFYITPLNITTNRQNPKDTIIDRTDAKHVKCVGSVYIFWFTLFHSFTQPFNSEHF